MQVKNSFDKETLIKIGKGALIALTGGAAISVLTYLQSQDFGVTFINGFIAWVVPVTINAIKEYLKGQ